jgi:hypothetical protein
VNWNNYDFGIAKATYGARKDAKTVLHAEKIRAAGKTLGIYHFFLPNTAVQAQLDAFYEVATAVSLGDGDIVPCIDIEAYPDKFKGKVPTHYCQVSPSWAEPLTEFIYQIEKRFGSCMPYITQLDWSLLGKPSWLLQRPLWVAHYPKIGSTVPLKAPATPGNRPYTIWQLMVGPLGKSLQDPQNPAAVDQNVSNGPLPLIDMNLETSAQLVTLLDMPSPIAETGIPFIGLSDEDWEEMRIARDRHFQEE